MVNRLTRWVEFLELRWKRRDFQTLPLGRLMQEVPSSPRNLIWTSFSGDGQAWETPWWDSGPPPFRRGCREGHRGHEKFSQRKALANIPGLQQALRQCVLSSENKVTFGKWTCSLSTRGVQGEADHVQKSVELEPEERDLKFNGTHLLDLLQSPSVSQSADVSLMLGTFWSPVTLEVLSWSVHQWALSTVTRPAFSELPKQDHSSLW